MPAPLIQTKLIKAALVKFADDPERLRRVVKRLEEGMAARKKGNDREWRTKNRDKRAAYEREYRVKNKDKLAAYRVKNKDRIAANASEYYTQNKDKWSEWRAKNRDEIRAYKREYYYKNKDEILARRRELYDINGVRDKILDKSYNHLLNKLNKTLSLIHI